MLNAVREKWNGTMTDRERFNNQMHYKPVDRCFNMEFGYWKECFTAWDIFTGNGIENTQQANAMFGFDRVGHIGGVSFMHPRFEEKVIEERENTVIKINTEGLLAEVAKDGHETIPHYLESSIKTPDDWKRVKEERFDINHPDRKLDIAALKALHPDDRDYPLAVDCGSMIGRIRDMMTFEGICYAAYDYPDMVEDMVETCCQLVEHALDQLLPHFDFDLASGWEDICFNYGPILSPDFFRSVIGPRYKRIGDRLHANGIDIWYTDCDGDVRPLLPIFMDAGINCLFPFEVKSCAHPGELLDEYEGLRIMGGVDKIKMIEGPASIKAYLKTLEKYVARGGYIPFCDHLCPPDVSPENYLYYLDLKREMFG